MERIPYLIIAALLPVLGLAQAVEEQPLPPAPPAGVLQGQWDAKAARANAAQWEQVNEARPNNAANQLNWLLSEYNARRSSNNGAWKASDQAELEQIASVIKADAPASFEARLADYYVEFPQAEAFRQLEAARQLAPDRAELLAPLLNRAMLAGNAEELHARSAELLRRGGVAQPLLHAAKDVLLCLPANAVLFINGDMDGQPIIVRQSQQRDHPGVLLVDRRLLANKGYRERIWTEAGGQGAAPAAGPGFARGLMNAGMRPVYLALSLDLDWLAAFPGQLHAVGAAFRAGPPRADDAAALEKHWSAMAKPRNAGPLSRNYLLPGAVLLEQYRAAGADAKARGLEKELRQIAGATGGLSDLEKMGVLQP